MNDVRTIEVVPKKSNPYGNHIGWTFSGTYWGNNVYDTKKEAVKYAKKMAKREARSKNHSMEVKIFKKDGSYQDEHVYKP